MEDETTAAVDSIRLIKSLEKLGVTADIITLQKWSKQGLIPAYETGHQHKQMKRGRPKNTEKSKKGRMKKAEDRIQQKGRPGLRSKWPPETVEEATAVWAVKYCNRDYKGNVIPPKAVTPETIGKVQRIARDMRSSPHPLYKIKERMIDSRWPDDPFTYKDLEMKLDRDDRLHRLAVTYIAAVEKARRGISVEEPKRVVLKRYLRNRWLKEPFSDEMLSRRRETYYAALERAPEGIPGEPTEVALKQDIPKRQLPQRDQKPPTPHLAFTPQMVVDSRVDVDLEPTNAECDEIVLLVRQPGSEEWVDSRKLVMQPG
jgi:hypothetical protein